MRLLIPFQSVIHGGLARVSFLLIRELLGQVETVVVLLPEEELAFFRANLPASDRLVLVPTFAFKRARSLRGAGRAASWLNHLKALWLIRRHRLTHCLGIDTGSFSTAIGMRRGFPIPSALVFHDLYWSLYQEGVAADRKELAAKYAHLVERADLSIAVSRRTYAELRECVPGLESKLRCIPLPADPQPSRGSPAGPPPFRKDRFTFYYPAAAYGNKNHLLLFKAAKALLDKGLSFRIVLTGPGTDGLWKEAEGSEKVAAARRYHAENPGALEGCLVFLGYLDFAQVEACYAACDCVVLPSVYEGYGLPLTEALLRGAPVIASDIDGFKEQAALYRCEDWVSFFESGRLEALVARMEEMLLAPRPRLDPGEVARRFAAWTPADFAKRYVETLASVGRPERSG